MTGAAKLVFHFDDQGSVAKSTHTGVVAQIDWRPQFPFARIMVGLVTESAEHKTIMIDATYLKAHRTASSLRVKKGGVNVRSGGPKVA